MSLSASLLLTICFVGAGPNQLPSPSELVAGYHANASLFAKARITWQYRHKDTVHFLKAQERNAQLIELQAQRPEHSQEEETAMLRQARALRDEGSGPPRDSVFLQDFWTDGVRRQVRIPSLRLDPSAARLWHFPDEPLTPYSLSSVYRDITILSYRPDTTETLRIWAGNWSNPNSTSSVRSSPLEDSYSDFMYPPLVSHSQSVAERFIHPIDRFFRLPVAEMRVLGDLAIEGVRTYLLQHRTISKSSLQGDHGATFHYADTITAFVAPSRGYLPVRIEYRSDRMVDEQPVEEEPSKPLRIVKCVSSKAGTGGAFFPTEGVEEVYAADPSNPRYGALQTAASFRERAALMPAVLYHETTWSVDRVDLNPKMPDSMYALEFPNKTRFYNAILGREQVTGVPDQVVDQMLKPPGVVIARDYEPATSQLRGALLLVGSVLLLIGAIAVLCIRCTRRARARE